MDTRQLLDLARTLAIAKEKQRLRDEEFDNMISYIAPSFGLEEEELRKAVSKVKNSEREFTLNLVIAAVCLGALVTTAFCLQLQSML